MPAKKKTAKAKKQAKVNPWLTHVQSVRSKNPELSYKAVLQKAKENYKRPA